MARLGFIKIAPPVLKDAMAILLDRVHMISCVYLENDGAYEMLAESDHFEEASEGECPPAYVVIVNKLNENDFSVEFINEATQS